MKLSIIVPFLNEEQEIPGLCAHLQAFKDKGCEIILVDGGSKDLSSSLAQKQGFHVLHTQSGRAHQMNIGAKSATGDVFLFLHADTRPPSMADTDICKKLISDQYHWGRFDVSITGQSPLLKIIAWFINKRSELSSIATGDQGIFVKRTVFERIGGFPSQCLMEDIELSIRLKKHSRPACLSTKVVTSGRRWETRGIWHTIFLMWRLRFAYWLGISPQALAKHYV